ncbi:acetoin utilization protein AcuC [Miltoncostaea marina]|uniref:acetoin utilization protein AcuC n=1 Tax=Miltoncostaea marina TaxID=2843215 RepID=UPI001C3C6068|nr:acetoin utilization protein AcuC [Miltoncostaea marina]
MTTTAFVHAEGGPSYNLGDEHPMTPLRRQLAVSLIKAYGLDRRPGVVPVVPGSATDEQIERVHAPAFVAAVRRYSRNPALAAAWEAGQWGLAAGGDTPAFAGMHEAAAAICGASIAGAMEVWEGRADQAFVASGGLHHAFANRAAGFCVYNDTAVAIQALLDAGAERVAYIDIDVHHGDGTQWIFFEEPRVLTASVHETGRYLFPGTGFLSERGVGAAEGTALNVPLPPHAGDRPYLRAIEEVIAPAVLAFDPDVIVTQDGADPHHADPLAHLQVTLSAFPRAYRALHRLAREACDGRWVALGGGGYTFQVVPRAWTMLFAEMIGAELDDEIPSEWWQPAEQALGVPLPRRMSDDPPPEVSEEERIRADAEGDRVVDEARALFLR